MKYRKKPVVIEAFRMTKKEMNSDGSNWPDWLMNALAMAPAQIGAVFQNVKGDLTIHTLEGGHKVSPGDYIIKGIKGELYPCKPDIFGATYEPVEEA